MFARNPGYDARKLLGEAGCLHLGAVVPLGGAVLTACAPDQPLLDSLLILNCCTCRRV
jgi:hypothetical protein